MKTLRWVSLCSLILFASLAACAPSRLAIDYGTAFKQQKMHQIADPGAGDRVEPSTGMNGKAAEAAMGKYQKGFEKEPPAPAYRLTIDGIK